MSIPNQRCLHALRVDRHDPPGCEAIPSNGHGHRLHGIAPVTPASMLAAAGCVQATLL